MTRQLTGARKVDADVEIAAIEAMHADVARSPDLRATTMRLDSLLRVLDYPGNQRRPLVVRESRCGAAAREAG